MTDRNSFIESFRSMLPVVLTELILSGVMIGVYALLERLTTKVLLGAALGTAATLVNFAVMILSLLKAKKSETPEKGQLYMRGTYMIRMFVLLAVLVVAIKTGYFDTLATVLPLCFMRLALFIPQFRTKKEVQP